MAKDETIEFENVEVRHATERALLCVIDGEEYWMPKSQIASGSELDESSEAGDKGSLLVSEWIAREKGLS